MVQKTSSLPFLNVVHSGDDSPEPIVERIHNAVRQEILNNRWKTGELLPHPTDIASVTGASRASVSRAYERLAGEGFIKRIKRKGSVVISTTPAITKERLRIGVALCNPSNPSLFHSESFAQNLAWTCLEYLKDIGHKSDVMVISDTQVLQKDGIPSAEVFSTQPDGVLAVGPVPKIFGDDGRAIPVMYLHRSADDLRPCVMGDAQEAIRLLTLAAIEHGHRKILLVGNPERRDSSFIRWHYHRVWMERNQLAASESGFQDSLNFDHRDPRAWNEFLLSHPDVTCFISAERVRSAQSLAAAAVLLGKRMPEDFSLLSYGRCFFTSETGKAWVTSVDHNLRSLIKIAVDILLRQIRGESSDVFSPLIVPYFIQGDTLGAAPTDIVSAPA